MLSSQYKKVIINAVKKAGAKSAKAYYNFNRATIRLKSTHEIVTNYDLESERIIIREIQRAFPGHSILAEESGETIEQSEYLWIIDPIDGTTNFSMHNPLWAISVGLAHRGEIILGVIFAPILDELFLAEKDKGFSVNGKNKKVSLIKDGKVLNTFCHGSTDNDIKRAVSYFAKQKFNKLDCRQLGSASVELAYVASGRIESIVIPGVKAWDAAAGVLMVREAGGVVTDFSGNNWNLRSKDIVASNGIVHDEILSVLGRL